MPAFFWCFSLRLLGFPCFFSSLFFFALSVIFHSLTHTFIPFSLFVCSFPFSSERKRMSTVIEGGKKCPAVLHSKGASEIILGLCTSYVDPEGAVRALKEDDIEEIKNTITEFASAGLRTLCIAYKELDVCCVKREKEMKGLQGKGGRREEGESANVASGDPAGSAEPT